MVKRTVKVKKQPVALSADFRDFLTLMNKHGVEYLTIGGYAVNAYGFIRATKDIDFWFHNTPENCARLEAVTREFGVMPFDKEELAEPGMVFQTGFEPERIDLLNSAGRDFEGALSRSSLEVVDGVPLRLIALEDLLNLKRFAGRPKDLEDIRRLGGQVT